MGFYVETDSNHDKAEFLIKNSTSGRLVSIEHAAICSTDNDYGVFVIVDNGPFEAASFCFEPKEFTRFVRRAMCLSPTDKLYLDEGGRPMQFVVMNRDEAKTLTGYKGK